VKKEIQFLVNYTNMLNQQKAGTTTEINVNGDYEKLKISPLLLAGFIDRITGGNSTAEKRMFTMELNFSGNQMSIAITENQGKDNLLSLQKDNDVIRRLTELYPGKFSFINSAGGGPHKLIILLDEER
jgi:hypothetical protein